MAVCRPLGAACMSLPVLLTPDGNVGSGAGRRERAVSVSRARLSAPTYCQRARRRTRHSRMHAYALHTGAPTCAVFAALAFTDAPYMRTSQMHRAAVPARADVAAFVASTPYTSETPRVRPELRGCGAWSAPALVTEHVSTVDRIPHECAACRFAIPALLHSPFSTSDPQLGGAPGCCAERARGATVHAGYFS